MYPENTQDPQDLTLRQRGEKPFEPTPMELRKQFNTLDAVIRVRSTKLKQENGKAEMQNLNDDDGDGFLPPYNSAF